MPPVILTFWRPTRDGRHRDDLPPKVEDHHGIDDAIEALALAIDEEREGAYIGCQRVVATAAAIDGDPLDLWPEARERVASWRSEAREERAMRRVA